MTLSAEQRRRSDALAERHGDITDVTLAEFMGLGFVSLNEDGSARSLDGWDAVTAAYCAMPDDARRRFDWRLHFTLHPESLDALGGFVQGAKT